MKRSLLSRARQWALQILEADCFVSYGSMSHLKHGRYRSAMRHRQGLLIILTSGKRVVWRCASGLAMAVVAILRGYAGNHVWTTQATGTRYGGSIAPVLQVASCGGVDVVSEGNRSERAFSGFACRFNPNLPSK